MKEHIQYNFLQDGHFAELKKAELLNDRINALQAIEQYIGTFYSKGWVQRNVLNMTDAEIDEMQKDINKETGMDTDNGGIELIVLGEQAGAWGTTTNNNFSIIARLINGVKTITLSSEGTSKLITSDGSLSDGMFKVIVLAGSPDTGHIITIEPEGAEKLYFVKNGTSQDIAFSQGSGDNATVEANKGIQFLINPTKIIKQQIRHS